MQSVLVGQQLDIFGGAVPVFRNIPNNEPLPDPSLWSESVREKMIDALISFACDSRRGDKMPESIMDCATLLGERIRGVAVDRYDFLVTLGWITGYLDGALPYAYVCAINGIDPETLQDVIYSSSVLMRDLRELQHVCCGTLI